MQNKKKSTGTYYTPQLLADFIVFHLFSNYSFGRKIDVLEPSSGDGVFFDSLFQNQNFNKKRYNLSSQLSIDAVEREPESIEISERKTDTYIKRPHAINYINKDYLQYHLSSEKKYDLIIGNPPYIKSNYLDDEQIKACEEIHKSANLGLKRIKNIWTSFLVGGVESLSDDGVLCFVLPAELLQVIYAKELRDYLKVNFARIEIFAFNELIFEEIEQDVIIIICSKQKSEKGVSFYQVEHLEDLKEPHYVQKNSNIHRTTLDKWTNYILSDEDLKYLDSLKDKIMPIREYCRAEVGIVTAANDYFITDRQTVQSYKLDPIAYPILKKSSHIEQSSVSFTEEDFSKIVELDRPGYFLKFDDQDMTFMPKSYQEYLKLGLYQNLHRRYKTLLRKRWYIVPSLWISQGFFTKRSNIFPRMVVNEAGVMVTDSFYRIEPKDGYDIHDLVFSFYNSLTFIYAELEGRYYGGGVLELTPNEYKNLGIPYVKKVPKRHFKKLEKLLRANATVDEILDYTDDKILGKVLGLNEKELARLREIYQKLLLRRLKMTNS